jgi:hypothetical protein
MVALFIIMQGVVLSTLISLDYYHPLFLILVALTVIQYLYVAFSDPGYYNPSY